MDIRALDRIITIKPEPQTTPSLAQAITRAKACETVSDYHFTPVSAGALPTGLRVHRAPQWAGLLGAGRIRRWQDALSGHAYRPPHLG
jgi:hypothetical protein